MSKKEDPIFIDLAQLSGVDAETFERADRGDRAAQKVMMRNLLTRDASAEALTTHDWMHWILRMIATGASQSTSDALGAIAEAGRTGRITKAEQGALNELFEQYFGPEPVGPATAKNVLKAFKGKQRETTVLELFLLADRLASGDPSVTSKEVWNAADRAASMNAPGAQAFFRAVWAQITCTSDALTAFEVGLDALKTLEPLAEQDAVYRVKMGQLALLVSQIAQMTGETAASTLVQLMYADQIAAYNASDEQA